MSGSASPDQQTEHALKALDRRAKAILKLRPAYREMVDFYLTVFRCQIRWRNKLVVHPQTADRDQRQQYLGQGRPLVEYLDPGIEWKSLQALWSEMKTVFWRGNAVLGHAVDRIQAAEIDGAFTAATWLLEQRPDRYEMVADASQQLGVEESVLASLARAVTFPHWDLVAQGWLSNNGVEEWRRFSCPTCGGPPGLAEDRPERSAGDGVTATVRRLMHCPFCGSCWAVPTLTCPACDSTQPGDAKYYYTADEPDLRIDFCKSCDHYIKVVRSDKITGRLHLGLELLTTVHLDEIAQEKDLSPLAVCA